LERKLLELEMRERARSIDIKNLMGELTEFQVEYYKRLEDLELKLDQTLAGLAIKCDKLEKVVVRYKIDRPVSVVAPPSTEQADLSREEQPPVLQTIGTADY
jgi:hypothetical protein